LKLQSKSQTSHSRSVLHCAGGRSRKGRNYRKLCVRLVLLSRVNVARAFWRKLRDGFISDSAERDRNRKNRNEVGPDGAVCVYIKRTGFRGFRTPSVAALLHKPKFTQSAHHGSGNCALFFRATRPFHESFIPIGI
jgi:hypothetical protein